MDRACKMLAPDNNMSLLRRLVVAMPKKEALLIDEKRNKNESFLNL